MNRLVFAVVFLAMCWMAAPAQAQLRQDVPRTAPAPFKLLGNTGFLLNQLFSPEHFQMRHSYELSYNSMGGSGLMAGIYTNSMIWQFGSKLAARVDIGLMHTPMATGVFQQMVGNQGAGRIFLRNAEVAYRPTENLQFHLSIRQSPYGMYARPYGYAGYMPYHHPWGSQR